MRMFLFCIKVKVWALEHTQTRWGKGKVWGISTWTHTVTQSPQRVCYTYIACTAHSIMYRMYTYITFPPHLYNIWSMYWLQKHPDVSVCEISWYNEYTVGRWEGETEQLERNGIGGALQLIFNDPNRFVSQIMSSYTNCTFVKVFLTLNAYREKTFASPLEPTIWFIHNYYNTT